MITYRLECDVFNAMLVKSALKEMLDRKIKIAYHAFIRDDTRTFFFVTVDNENILPKNIIGWERMIVI